MQQINQLSHVESTPIQIIKYLDAGSFSQVFLCQTPTNLAVLKITSSPPHMQSISKELDILKALKKQQNDYLGAFLVGYYAGEVTHSHACLLLEYCKMNLVQYMNSMMPNQFPITTVLHIMYDISQALYFLHANGIIHRDVKLENVLLKDQRQSGSTYTPTYCLCDFGSCTTKTIPYNTLPHNVEEIKYDIEQFTTLQYRAPELIDLHLRRGISTKVDVWALGCLLFKLLYYRNPFDNEYGILSYNNNITQLLLQTNKTIPLEVKAMLEKSLWTDPVDRWNVWNVLSQLCEIKGSNCPLQNIFQEEQIQRQTVAPADKSVHPLIKAATNSQQGLLNQAVGMTDLAQQRRANRAKTHPVDLNASLVDSFEDSNKFPSLEKLNSPRISTTSAIPSLPQTDMFPDLDSFEASYGNRSSVPAPLFNQFEPQSDSNLSPQGNNFSSGSRKASLKHSNIVDDPALLLQNIIKSTDLEDIGLLLKWSWQKYHAKEDPIASILAQIRILMGQIGVITTNVRSVFRACLALHSLLLYGPSTVPSQSNLESVLQSLEGYQNRMSSFYARYLREFCSLLKQNSMSGRYRGGKARNLTTLARAILTHIQIHVDRFLNMREAMGANSDIGLCLFLFSQDAMMAIASVSEMITNGIYF
eukprot:NODE_6_length_70510_cov_1.054395.p6 type:complete len:644 gc:universal NODE_6_length_70510_cov_1.054395:61612-63543(+)